MRNPVPGRRGRLVAAGVVAVTLGAGLSGLISGCSAHQEAASPTEQPEQGAPNSSGTGGQSGGQAVAPLPLPKPQPTTPLVRPGTGLDAQDRARLTEAQRMGAKWVVMVVQTDQRRSDETRRTLTSLGAIVGTTSPAPGFLSVTVPVADAQRVASAPGVTAADVTEVVPPNQPRTNGNR